jgi:catechol 2,3-dioxygenase-like lactoylglutathione lyase family enzyme
MTDITTADADNDRTPVIAAFDHIGLTVRDLETSIAWYQNVFKAEIVDGDFPHYGREWTGFARLLVEPHTKTAFGLHHNTANEGEEMNEARTGLDHVSFRVDGRGALDAWAAWLDRLGVAHSGIQSVTKPFAYSTVIFRDLDNNQLEFIAPGV